MKVILNGELLEVPDNCTLEALLQRVGTAPDAQATAVNGEFVPRAGRAGLLLRERDAVTCFQPITGG